MGRYPITYEELIDKYHAQSNKLDALLVAAKNYHASKCGLPKICGHEFTCVCAAELLVNTIEAIEK